MVLIYNFEKEKERINQAKKEELISMSDWTRTCKLLKIARERMPHTWTGEELEKAYLEVEAEYRGKEI